MSPDAFARIFDVSRETLDCLILFADLLENWQKSLNLVGAETMKDFWRRHILDSAQLIPYVENTDRVVTDLGTGAGFPGLVLSIILNKKVGLVESSGKKISFLKEAARITGAPVSIHHGRIESLVLPKSDIIVSRALAPLDKLLSLSFPHLGPDGTCLFLKGRRFDEELTVAEKKWKMRIQSFSSITDSGGKIILIEDIRRA